LLRRDWVHRPCPAGISTRRGPPSRRS
jgi:hypothetical protein